MLKFSSFSDRMSTRSAQIVLGGYVNNIRLRCATSVRSAAWYCSVIVGYTVY